jgi:hypothetical protein
MKTTIQHQIVIDMRAFRRRARKYINKRKWHVAVVRCSLYGGYPWKMARDEVYAILDARTANAI